MSEWLSFQFDLISFILGFAAATVFWWLLNRVLKAVPTVISYYKSLAERWRQQNFANVDRYLRFDVEKRAQRNHIASQLFALDEILIEPLLLVPTENEISNLHTLKTLASTTIPYHPDWPEITSQYPYPVITIAQAIQKNANLAVISAAGCGKTVTLAHLAILLAKKDSSVGAKKNSFPLHLHVNDITLPRTEEDDPLAVLISIIVNRSPFIIQKRIPTFLKDLETGGNLILILDGLDELHPQSLIQYVNFLKSLISKHPKIQIIVSSSSQYSDGIFQIGLIPLSLASWSHLDRTNFITKWGSLWSKTIIPEIQKIAQTETVDPIVLNNWLDSDNITLTALEWTLRIWSLYAGDLTGGSNLNAIHAYIERVSKGIVSIGHLQNLAVGFLNAQKNAAPFSEIESYFSKTGLSTQSTPTSHQSEIDDKAFTRSKKSSKLTSTTRVIDGLIRSGLMSEFTGGIISFSHPVITGYLASFLVIEPNLETDSEIFDDPVWILTDLVQHYLAAQGRAIELIENLLLYPDPPLFRNLFRISRWIKDVPVNLPWRTQVMRQLVQLIHREDLPISVRSRFFTAAAYTNDQSISTLFRQLLASSSAPVHQLAALGCGALQDRKSIEGLTRLLSDQSSETQLSAAFAIGIIKSTSLLTLTEDLIKSGDENLSQAAAECLAANPNEGFPILQSSAESDQILVRRAAIIGLAQTHQDWAVAIIEKLAVQDGQWVVRNVAGQTLEMLKLHPGFIPSPLPPAHDSAWLLSFASQLGIGIPVGQPGMEVLLSALQSGTIEQKIASMDYLRSIHTQDAISAINQAIRDSNRQVQQAAVNTLWLYALSGIRVSI